VEDRSLTDILHAATTVSAAYHETGGNLMAMLGALTGQGGAPPQASGTTPMPMYLRTPQPLRIPIPPPPPPLVPVRVTPPPPMLAGAPPVPQTFHSPMASQSYYTPPPLPSLAAISAGMPAFPTLPYTLGTEAALGSDIPFLRRSSPMTPFARPFEAALDHYSQRGRMRAMDYIEATRLGGSMFSQAIAGTAGTAIGGTVGGLVGAPFGQTVTGATLGSVVGSLALTPMIANSTVLQRGYVAATRPGIERAIDTQVLQGISTRTVLGGSQLDLAGRGLSGSATADVVERMSETLQRNKGTLTRRDLLEMTSVAADSGLLDMAQNGPQLAKTMDTVIKLIGSVAQVTGDPDFRKNMRVIAALQSQGAELSQIRGLTMRMSDMARMSGMSLEQALSTGGVMGQQMGQALGVTGLTGMQLGLGGQAYARQAVNAGVFSRQQLALMGGTEGAEQRMIQLQGQMLQSMDALLPYLTRMTAQGGIEVDKERLASFRSGDVSLSQMIRDGANSMNMQKIQALENNKLKLRDDIGQGLGTQGMLQGTLSQIRRVQQQTGGRLDEMSAARVLGMDENTARMVIQMGQSREFLGSLAQQAEVSYQQARYSDMQKASEGQSTWSARYGSMLEMRDAPLVGGMLRTMSDAATGGYNRLQRRATDFYTDTIDRERLAGVGIHMDRASTDERMLMTLGGSVARRRAAAGPSELASGFTAGDNRVFADVMDLASIHLRAMVAPTQAVEDLWNAPQTMRRAYDRTGRWQDLYNRNRFNVSGEEYDILDGFEARPLPASVLGSLGGDDLLGRDLRGVKRRALRSSRITAQVEGTTYEQRADQRAEAVTALVADGMSPEEAEALVSKYERDLKDQTESRWFFESDTLDVDAFSKRKYTERVMEDRAGGFTGAGLRALQSDKVWRGIVAGGALRSKEVEIRVSATSQMGRELDAAASRGTFAQRFGGKAVDQLNTALEGLGLGAVGDMDDDQRAITRMLAEEDPEIAMLMTYLARSGNDGYEKASEWAGNDRARWAKVTQAKKKVEALPQRQVDILAQMGSRNLGFSLAGVSEIQQRVEALQSSAAMYQKTESDRHVSMLSLDVNGKSTATDVESYAKEYAGGDEAKRKRLLERAGSNRGRLRQLLEEYRTGAGDRSATLEALSGVILEGAGEIQTAGDYRTATESAETRAARQERDDTELMVAASVQKEASETFLQGVRTFVKLVKDPDAARTADALRSIKKE
jgi:hypothetical protein